MDPSFFGLDGHPFDSSSEADESYIAETHASLITELRAGLKAPHGITLLIGEEGTGKTTLVRKFADGSAETCTVAYLPTTGPGLRHLLTETIEQLGGSPPPAGDEQALLDCLASLARARAAHGRTTLVVVDDAHELPAKTIERVGRLFGDDPAEPSMLHVVLVGRPELLDRMNAANDRTILKHLVQVCRMDPIGPEESFRYIADRVAKVGGVVDKLFTEEALRLIVKRANGNPGRIDAICSAALEQAAESGEAAVATDAVDIACIEAESFTIDGNGKAAEKDPMQYIFGEDEVAEDGESRVSRRLHGGPNGTSDQMPASASEPPATLRATGATAMLMDAVSSVREQMGAATDSRKRLGVWALGLVVVLAGFAATMTNTGERARLGAKRAETMKVASAPATNASANGQAALPATAVRTSKLIVKRNEEIGTSPTAEPPANSPAAPTEAQAPAPAKADTQAPQASGPPTATGATLPHVQLPPLASHTQPSPPVAAPPTGLSAARPAAAVTTSQPAPVAAAPQAVPPPPQPAQAPKVAVQPTLLAAAQQAAKAPTPPALPQQAAAMKAPESKPAVQVVATAPPKPAVIITPSASTAAATVVASAKAPLTSPQSAGAPKWTVQVGAFKSRVNADALVDKIRKSYPDARVVVAQASGASVFRVVSGAFASKTAADSRAKTLAQTGYTTFVRDIEQ